MSSTVEARRLRPGAKSYAATVLVVISLLTPERLTAQAAMQMCEREHVNSESPFGYQQRGERCEGLIKQKVSGTPLYLVSYTEYFDYENLGLSDSLTVDWWAPAASEVTIRAESVSPRLHYRMDAVRPAGNSSFRWPADLLVAQKIANTQIGALGWSSFSFAGRGERLYLPLRIRSGSSTVRCGEPYRFVIWNGPKLKEVYVTVTPVDSNGRFGTAIWDEKPLNYRYYPAQQPIRIKLPELTEGTYHVKVVGEASSGTAVPPVEAWIFHPGAEGANCAG